MLLCMSGWCPLLYFPTYSMAEQNGANCISILNTSDVKTMIILFKNNKLLSLFTAMDYTKKHSCYAVTSSFSIHIYIKLKVTTMVSFSILAKQMLQFLSPRSLIPGYYHVRGSSMAGVLCNTMT